nr:helix-turn-helix transcriptional regulator [Micromonospora sp. DSM 115978]
HDVGDLVVHRLAGAAGVCALLVLVTPAGREFEPADENVLALIGPELSRIFCLHATICADVTLLARLSPRGQDVLRAVAKGYSNAEIAGMLNMSLHSVKQHAMRAMRVTGCKNRTQLALLWHRSSGALVPSVDVAGL